MEFFEKTGRMAIGSRLRLLAERMTTDAAAIYEMYGVDLKPKWFPVFFSLSHGEAKSVTEIAREIGHTHPSVSYIVGEMSARGLLCERRDPTDARRNVVRLTPEGCAMVAALAEQCADVDEAVGRISRETRNDLWRALGEWEELLEQRSLSERVKEVRRERERQRVEIVPFEPRFQPVFRQLNEEWITSRWTLEEADRKALDHPQEYILDRGGRIFVALWRGEAVGVCALCRMDDPHYDYELAKYAVSPRAQGLGIGTMLGEAVVAEARRLGARRLFLESNTLLRPAIRIYRKLGFVELREFHPSYARGDIQMELILSGSSSPGDAL